MNILFALSECLPFVASGGLADVGGSLPQAIKRLGNDEVRVILPLYASVKKNYSNKLKSLGVATIKLDWREQQCELFTLTQNNIVYYFVGEDYYFDRENLYGYDDDIERFAFFSKAVVTLLDKLDFTPDIISCHDWQTALIPAYTVDERIDAKTILTIHNIEYQGRFSIAHLQDLTGLDTRYQGFFEWNGWGNLLKGGIIACNMLTTVSPNYAKEILSPYFSAGLSPVIEQNKYKLYGILNGIDYQLYNPQDDASLTANYTIQDVSNKAKCKEMLQKQLGLPINPNIPLFGMVTRLAEHKGLKLVEEALPKFIGSDMIQFVILGSGDYHYESHFNYLANTYDNVATRIAFDKTLAKSIYAGADFLIMPSLSEPCGLAQMIACRYGTIPLVRGVGGLYDSIKDGLNGIVFYDFNCDALDWAINKAINGFNDKKTLEFLRKNAMSSDFSWNLSAKQYQELYNKLLKK